MRAVPTAAPAPKQLDNPGEQRHGDTATWSCLRPCCRYRVVVLPLCCLVVLSCRHWVVFLLSCCCFVVLLACCRVACQVAIFKMLTKLNNNQRSERIVPSIACIDNIQTLYYIGWIKPPGDLPYVPISPAKKGCPRLTRGRKGGTCMLR
jgi:hypothetical protein